MLEKNKLIIAKFENVRNDSESRTFLFARKACNAAPDVTTTISNDIKRQPATSTRVAISDSFSDTDLHDLGSLSTNHE